MGIVRVDRRIPVCNLDGTWGKLDTSRCISVEGYWASYYKTCFLHKTHNGRWYVEEFNPENGRSEAKELSLDGAMDWILDHAYDKLSELNILEDLPDVVRTPTPPHGGGLVVKCLKCRALSSAARESRSRTEKAIIATLRRVSKPVSGKQLAGMASLKYNSNFRSILSRLVARSVVLRPNGKNGYILADKVLS